MSDKRVKISVVDHTKIPFPEVDHAFEKMKETHIISHHDEIVVLEDEVTVLEYKTGCNVYTRYIVFTHQDDLYSITQRFEEGIYDPVKTNVMPAYSIGLFNKYKEEKSNRRNNE
ncbi:hypothetical protein DZB91_20065 [Brevibacillus sp. VP]|uniref:hypothetical protein n=1 Tax=Brevibacillus sp. VP TaxID=2293326 RepID=UPI000E2F0160|nr:hypothetical protein [Brevibacillus sp. VP]RFB31381.1 hypothetical protein DZB91_20065 [Brevibacillus sp. VP]